MNIDLLEDHHTSSPGRTSMMLLVGFMLAIAPIQFSFAEGLEKKIERFERRLAEQERRLQEQREELERVRGLLQARELEFQRGRGVRGGNAAISETSSPTANAPAGQRSREMLSQASSEDERPPQKPVGKAPEARAEVERPEIPELSNIGGVLTPKGTLVLEPTIQYSNSQVNRFTFVGVEILETFLIGLLEAEDADRDLLSPQLSVRYGLTDRLELETKIPFVYREDRLSATVPQTVPPTTTTRELSGDGIGDVEFALHYQMNRGLGGWPFFIGNLRYKTTTGKGPFDVSRTSDGFETELPTGSGFQSLEPSVTMLLPTDPAVIYANAGYVINFSDDVNQTFGSQTIGNVDPGDAFRLSFGMAFALNPRTSFTFGYKHDFINESETVVNGVSLRSSSLDIGALLLGGSYRISERVSTNLNLELGITADAPDVLMTLKIPVSFDLF